ncbi:hypothetical protein B0H14DRAFT_2583213 [Mycena olivaceomarginata]|nr:hypothetical protein B0H14DRAFT_2583213 [Mycena olivaceomarginata]
MYQHIVVQGTATRKLVSALAYNATLPPLSTTTPPTVNLAEWTLVLPALVNLRHLGITPGIPLPQDVIHRLPFRLTIFSALCEVGGTWAELVASQPGLHSVYVDSDFWGDVPGPNQLPNIESLKARPRDVARFAEIHALVNLWIFTGTPLATQVLTPSQLSQFAVSPSQLSGLRISAPDFLLLFDAAPDLVLMLRHLVLDEDLSWSGFTLDAGEETLLDSTIAKVAAVLDGQFLHLLSVLLVCSGSARDRAERRPLLLCDAPCFQKIFAANCRARGVRTFLFYARDGYARWTNWGLDEEVVSYAHGTDGDEIKVEVNRSMSQKRKQRSLLPRPPLPQVAAPGRVRPIPRPQPSAQDSAKPETKTDPVDQARWGSFTSALVAELMSPSADKTRDVKEEDSEAERARLEQEMARDQAWDAAVAVALEAMGELDRRKWFRDQCMQEEQEAKNARVHTQLDDGWCDISTSGYIDE